MRVKLGDVANIKHGATPSSQIATYWNGTIPWCTPTDVTRTVGKYLIETERRITEQGLASCGTSLLPVGALLLCSRATIGEVKIATFPVCANQGFKALVAKEDLYHEFLYYLLALLKPQLIKRATGSTFLEISKCDIASIELDIPPYHEQRVIAEALSDVDRMLGALELLIAKKNAIMLASMQQLLTGKVRLDGFGERWEITRLGHVAHIKTGSRNNQDKVDDGEYPFFVRSPHVERIDSYSFEGEAILVPGEGDIGSIFHYVNGRYDVHQRVYNVSQFAKNVCGKFLYYSMTLNFGSHAMQNTVKATVDSLRLPTFTKFRFPLPTDIAEQRAIAAIITDLDAEIGALEARREKMLAIKQGMMQQLLTGRVRLVKSVSVPEGESAS